MPDPASAPSYRAAVPSRRVGEELADVILQDVLDRGWPVGETLGVESALRTRYGVSRGSLREAIRLLEELGVAETRRGASGGLRVTGEAHEAVSATVRLYLEFTDTTIGELTEARALVEDLAVEMASTRDGPIVWALGAPDRPRDFHARLAGRCGNPPIRILAATLTHIARAMVLPAAREARGEEIAAEATVAHERVSALLVAGDITAARAVLREHIQRLSAWSASPDTGIGTYLAAHPGPDDGRKRGAEVARRLAEVMWRDGLEPGDPLGTEAELVHRLEVARSTFREATTLLGYFGLVVSRRGVGGGLRRGTATPLAPARSIARYLVSVGADQAELTAARIGLETRAMRLALARADDVALARLEEPPDGLAPWGTSEPLQDIANLHTAIAALSGNRVLELCVAALTAMALLRGSDGLGSAGVRVLRDDHAELVTTLRDRDEQAAEALLVEHLLRAGG